MLNDNSLEMVLSMGQKAPEGELSQASLSISYPTVNRHIANVMQYETVFSVYCTNVNFALTQAADDPDPEMLKMYLQSLDAQAARLAAMSAEYKKVVKK